MAKKHRKVPYLLLLLWKYAEHAPYKIIRIYWENFLINICLKLVYLFFLSVKYTFLLHFVLELCALLLLTVQLLLKTRWIGFRNVELSILNYCRIVKLNHCCGFPIIGSIGHFPVLYLRPFMDRIKLKLLLICPKLRNSVADPGCLSRIRNFIHPGSYIWDSRSKNGNKRWGGKNVLSFLFCSHKYHKIETYFTIEQLKKKTLAN